MLNYAADGSGLIPRTLSQTQGIDAVAQASWLRAVWKHMAQMRITFSTHNLCAQHAEAPVFLGDHRAGFDRLPKAGPTSAGLKFFIGIEQVLAATDTAIGTGFGSIMIFAGKGALCSFFPGYVIFLRAELRLPFMGEVGLMSMQSGRSYR